MYYSLLFAIRLYYTNSLWARECGSVLPLVLDFWFILPTVTAEGDLRKN